jgi:hypothetical protein
VLAIMELWDTGLDDIVEIHACAYGGNQQDQSANQKKRAGSKPNSRNPANGQRVAKNYPNERVFDFH